MSRGDEEAALSLYRWCGASASYSERIYSSSASVTANGLVEEIRSTLDGSSRIRVARSRPPADHA